MLMTRDLAYIGLELMVAKSPQRATRHVTAIIAATVSRTHAMKFRRPCFYWTNYAKNCARKQTQNLLDRRIPSCVHERLTRSSVMSMYNVTLLGWDDGTFFPLHITAIVCISCSFIASIVVTVLSFKTHKKRFYTWPRSERFVVYLAICEMSFSFVHMFDHVTMVIEKDHVHPLELCQFYAFLMVFLLSIKNFILIVIALNAFLLIRFRRQMDFGIRDWRLCVYVMAFPIIVCTISVSLQYFGPAGAL